MKNLFPGYYHPTNDEFQKLWKHSIFILDANVLLNLYAYSTKTMNEFIKILEIVSDRLWIPHQVALEYQKRRLEVIQQQANAYENIRMGNKKALNISEQTLKTAVRQGKHPFIDMELLIIRVKNFYMSIEKELNEIERSHPDYFLQDPIRNNITKLLSSKVGPPYTEEELMNIHKEGHKRYARNIPPGYEDTDKGEPNKYGDLIIWYQILDKAKKDNKPVILVTDDTKEDWWWRFKGKTLGPRPELIHEIREKCGVLFYMYQSDQFMNFSNTHFELGVTSDAIKEAKSLIYNVGVEKLAERIKYLIKNKETKTLITIIDEFRPKDLADLLERLNSEERLYLFDMLEPDGAGEVLMELEAPAQATINNDLGDNVKKI